jgi:hypothetical protein
MCIGEESIFSKSRNYRNENGRTCKTPRKIIITRFTIGTQQTNDNTNKQGIVPFTCVSAALASMAMPGTYLHTTCFVNRCQLRSTNRNKTLTIAAAGPWAFWNHKMKLVGNKNQNRWGQKKQRYL